VSLFAVLGRAGCNAHGPVCKSFLLLFFKKEALAYFCHPDFIVAGPAGKAWMPAFAGMTGDEDWGLNMEFFYHYQPKPDSKLAPPRSIP
jgi:hypothetical protein